MPACSTTSLIFWYTILDRVGVTMRQLCTLVQIQQKKITLSGAALEELPFPSPKLRLGLTWERKSPQEDVTSKFIYQRNLTETEEQLGTEQLTQPLQKDKALEQCTCNRQKAPVPHLAQLTTLHLILFLFFLFSTFPLFFPSQLINYHICFTNCLIK